MRSVLAILPVAVMCLATSTVAARFDATKMLALAAGDSGTAPAGGHHYSLAKGKTVVSVSFIGPYTITYVNEYEAPRQRGFPYGY